MIAKDLAELEQAMFAIRVLCITVETGCIPRPMLPTRLSSVKVPKNMSTNCYLRVWELRAGSKLT